jgi:hypothetical protein
VQGCSREWQVTSTSPWASANGARNAACQGRLWSAVPGQGPGRVLMLRLRCGRNRAFVGEILQMTHWFGTEGSKVQILSPRPLPQKSSEICTVQSGSSLGFNAQIGSREPSAPYFKRWPSGEWFDISSDASPVAGSVRALVGPKTGLKPLCSPYADRQHPPSLPPHVHGWKAGAVLKIDRSGYTKPLRSSARFPIGTQPRGAPGGQKFGAAQTRVGEASCQELIFRRKIMRDMGGHERAATHACRTRRRS